MTIPPKKSGHTNFKKLAEFHDDLKTKPERERYSRAKKIMGILEKIVGEQNLLPDGFHTISQMSVTAADVIFEQALGSYVQSCMVVVKAKGHTRLWLIR